MKRKDYTSWTQRELRNEIVNRYGEDVLYDKEKLKAASEKDEELFDEYFDRLFRFR